MSTKLIDFDSIEHPDDEAVKRILAAYLIANKKAIEQRERTRLNKIVLDNLKLGKHKR